MASPSIITDPNSLDLDKWVQICNQEKRTLQIYSNRLKAASKCEQCVKEYTKNTIEEQIAATTAWIKQYDYAIATQDFMVGFKTLLNVPSTEATYAQDVERVKKQASEGEIGQKQLKMLKLLEDQPEFKRQLDVTGSPFLDNLIRRCQL